MALVYGIGAIHPSAANNKPHYVGFNTARTAADDTLFEVWAGATVSTIKAAVDLNGKYYSAALTAGDMLYAVAGGVSNVLRLDSLAISSAGKILRSDGSIPAWSTATFPLAATKGDLLHASAANVWGSLAKGTARQVLQTNAGATLPEWTSAVSLTTVIATSGLTLTGATVTGAPTWSSSQAITLSTAAQANVTSLGTLTALTVSGTVTMTAGISKIVPGVTSWGVRNNADSADNIIITNAGAVTFRSTVGGITTLTATTLAGTLSTAAQTNITSLGTLTTLQVDNININLNTISSTAGTDLNITPLAGQQIVLDGTIVIDAGVVTGATSITSTTFVGALSGNATTATTTTGNAGSATVLQTARTINGVSFNGSANITVTAAAGTLSGATLAAGVTASSLTSVGTLAGLTVTATITGSVSGSSGSTTGNAATATILQTGRTINGVSFNGSANITVTAAAGTLTGTTLKSTVVTSSLTSVGTLATLTVTGEITANGVVDLGDDLEFARVNANLAAGDNNNVATGTVTVQRFTPTSAGSTVTGFAGGRDGRLIIAVNVQASAVDITLSHQNASSTNTNRIITPNQTDFVLTRGESCLLYYDGIESRWHVIQGGV